MLKISLLGQPRIEVDGKLIHFGTRKATALLAYLATTSKSHSRTTLATLLWPEYGEQQSLASLRNTLWTMKKKGVSERFIQIDRHDIGLLRNADVRVDVESFRRTLARCQVDDDADDSLYHDCIDILPDAIALYRDDFLSGFTLRDSPNFDNWQMLQSDRFRRELVQALETLAHCYTLQDDYASAISCAHRLKELDPLEEGYYRRLMRLFALEGQRAAALRQYEECEQILREEFGIEPSDETTELYNAIKSGAFGQATVQESAQNRFEPLRYAQEQVPGSDLSGNLKARLYKAAEMVVEKPLKLIGRGSIVEQIQTLITANERVLLTGMGGVGKTSLAGVAAAQYIDAGYGSVIWVEAVNAEADAIFEAIARLFGEQIAMKNREDRVLAIRQLLLEKRGLIVLDNVWNERALFQTMKAIPPTLPVLVTSRHVIPIDGESVYVTGLNSSGAIELLNYHARQDYSDDLMAFTLCETLGYHPFAIEIAGKHLRIHPTLHPEQLLGNIGGTPHDLSIPSEYGEVGREGIKDLLDLSVRALSTEAHALFVMMGALFAPYASLKLLAALLGEPIDVIHEGLRTLQRHGLAVIFDARDNAPLHYQIHDLTYSYARTLHGRKTGYDALMITTIREFVETYVNDYDLLDFEQVNILGAAKYADEIDNKAALIDIMTMLMVDGYFDNRGHTNTLLFLVDRAISAADAMGEDYYRALHYLFSKRGNAFVERGDLDSAFLAYSRAVELASTPNRKATILTVISGVRFRQGASDYDDYLEQGYQIAVENNDDDVICRVLWHRGINAAQSHDLDAAHEYLTQSVEVAARMEDRSKPYLPLYNLGIVEIDRGEFENAIVTLERAYGIAMQADNQTWIAHALAGLGRAYHGLGKREKAQAYFQQALQLYHKLGQATAEAWVADLMKHESYIINSDSTEGV